MAALGASNPTVLDELTSNVSGLSNGACSIPPQVTSFRTTISSVYLYFDLIGSVSGDSASVTFYRPDGTPHQSFASGPITAGVNGFQCFVFALAVNGAAAASYPGVWTVKAFWDNSATPLFSLPFTLAPIPVITTVSSSALSGSGINAIAPGELITIKGVNLGPATPDSFSVTGGFVKSTLDSVIVIFDGVAGTPTYVSSTQINVVTPWELAGKTSSQMVVSFNGLESAIVPLQVNAVVPTMFTQDASGSGQAVAINLAVGVASIYNGPAGGTYTGTSIPTAPAPSGSTIVLLLTGGGVTSPPGFTGLVTPTSPAQPLKGWTFGSNVVTATIGGVPAVVQFAGAAPTLITGVVQMNIQVPNDVSGPALPVVFTIDGVQTQMTATVAVQSTAPTGVSVTVAPSTATVQTGGMQQFTVNVTGAITMAVDWSVNGIVGGNSLVGTIATTGLYTAPTGVPIPNVVTITASSAQDSTASAAAKVTITPNPHSITISSLSNSSPRPLTVLQIATTGLSLNAPVQIQLSDGHGFAATMQPIRVDSSGTIFMGVPIYVNMATEQVIAGTVSLTIVQGTQSSSPIALNIQNLPALSTFGVHPGQISHAFLIFEALLYAQRINELQALQPLLGSTLDTTPAQATLQTLLKAVLAARAEIDAIAQPNAAPISWGTLANGTKLQFDQNQLDLLDRILGVYLLQQFGATGIPVSSARPGAKDDSSTLSTILTGMDTVDGAKETTHDLQCAPDCGAMDVAQGGLDGMQTTLGILPATQSDGAAVGIIAGLGHVREATNNMLHSILPINQCLAQGCSASHVAELESDMSDSQTKFVSATAGTYAQVPAVLELETEAIAANVISKGLNFVLTIVKFATTGQLPAADNTDVAISTSPNLARLAVAAGKVNLENNQAAVQSSINLCCIGSTGITALADPSGAYESFVPVGVSGANYSNVTVSASDPLAGTSLGSEVVNLTGLTVSKPTQLAPITVSTTNTITWTVSGTLTAALGGIGLSGSVTLPASGGTGSFSANPATITVTVSGSTFTVSGTGFGAQSGGSCSGSASGSSAITSSGGMFFAAGPIAGMLNCTFADGSTENDPITGSFTARGK